MASKWTKMSTQVAMSLVLMTLFGRALAQPGCTTTLMGLASCLNYISGSAPTPPSSCCSQLSSVIQSQPQCLCQVLNGSAPSFGITINQTQALSLPSACKVQTPPVSVCNAVNQPSASPAASPVGSPTTSPADASTPRDSAVSGSPTETPHTVSSIPSKGTGSKSSTGSTSDGSMTKFSLPLTLFVLFITSSATVITRM